MFLRVLLAAVILAVTASGSFAAGNLQVAPADEYFGRFNLSILGIANLIHDASWRVNAGADPATIIEGPLAFASDGLHAWESKYPNDPWIAKNLVNLANDYRQIGTPRARRLAHDTIAWLAHDYPLSAIAYPSDDRNEAGLP